MNTTGIEIIDRTLVSYSGTEPKVIIDSDILAIADRAFYQNEKIESIVVNSPSLRTIGKEAFCGCRRLSEAKFSAIKGGIALSAFEGCSALRCFVIPNGIMEIGSGAFRRCAAHFVLQIPSSVDVIGDNIVDSSAIIVSASPNEEISKYGDKNRIAVKKDLNTVLKQLETRRLIEREGEERQFNIFGESITASNTLRIYQEVLEYYQREKQRLIDLALAGLPTQLSLSTAQKDAFLGVLESVNNGTKTLIKRVERWGIILPESTTFIDVLLPAAKLAKCGNLIIQGLTEGKNIADEMISDARDTLANEAESRVTGLSYGMLGSGLDMVLYSIDDFRERQRQRKAAYEEADRKQKAFIKNIEQDFKMPLTVISANTELIERKNGSDEQTKAIDRQIRKMTELVKHLGALAIFEEKDMAVSNINLSEVMQDFVESRKEKFDEKKIALDSNITPDINFEGDEQAIKKILSELAENALRYSLSKAEFTLKKKGDRIIIQQTNDTDLSNGSVDEIFDRFTTLGNAKDKNTTGLGLSYVKDIVKAHNGRVSAKVANGIFTLEIAL